MDVVLHQGGSVAASLKMADIDKCIFSEFAVSSD